MFATAIENCSQGFQFMHGSLAGRPGSARDGPTRCRMTRALNILTNHGSSAHRSVRDSVLTAHFLIQARGFSISSYLLALFIIHRTKPREWLARPFQSCGNSR
ncbi:MAG: hypothetical protein ABSF38_17485, partial [Verrucomicrobiota bacterium]